VNNTGRDKSMGTQRDVLMHMQSHLSTAHKGAMSPQQPEKPPPTWNPPFLEVLIGLPGDRLWSTIDTTLFTCRADEHHPLGAAQVLESYPAPDEAFLDTQQPAVAPAGLYAQHTSAYAAAHSTCTQRCSLNTTTPNSGT
jgi:hypothetical protein